MDKSSATETVDLRTLFRYNNLVYYKTQEFTVIGYQKHSPAQREDNSSSQKKPKTFKMFKYAVVIFAAIACAAAKPHVLAAAPFALAAPAPIITATSSQVVARNHNGIAFAPVVAPAPIAPLAPVAPVAKVVAPVAAPIAPLAVPAPLIARYAAAPAPLVARYAAAPFAYPAPLASYAAPAAFSYTPAYAPTLRYAAAAPAPVVW